MWGGGITVWVCIICYCFYTRFGQISVESTARGARDLEDMSNSSMGITNIERAPVVYIYLLTMNSA